MTFEDYHKIIIDILEKGYLMSLGTVDDGGPWVSDVIYVHDNNMNIYWLSKTATRHSKAIENSDQVAATITLSNSPDEPNLGLQIEGRATKLDGEHFELAAKHCQKRHQPEPAKDQPYLDDDRAWYQLKPTKIEIINQPLWGFKKQSVEF